MHAAVATRLQVDRQSVLLAKRGQRRQIALAQWLHVAEHQRHQVVAGSEFDLRNRIDRVHAAEQVGEQADLGTQRRMHHFALLDLGDEAGVLLFAETDQHAALLHHVAYRQAALAPVTPRFAGKRRQPQLRRDLADAFEIFRQHALLGRDLRRRIEVLQRAAAAMREMPATRLDPMRRRHEHFDDIGLVEVAMTFAQFGQYLFAQQRAADEHRLAVDAGHAATVMAEVGDVGFERGRRNGVGSGHETRTVEAAGAGRRLSQIGHDDVRRRRRDRKAYFFCQAPAAFW